MKTCLTTFILSAVFLHASLAAEGSLLENWIRNLERQTVEHPDDPKLLLDLADLLSLARRNEQALNLAQRALERAPNDAGFLSELSRVFFILGRTQKAIDLLLRAIQLNPNQAVYHFNLAVLYVTQQPPNRKDAKPHYLKSLALGLEPDPKLEKLLE